MLTSHPPGAHLPDQRLHHHRHLAQGEEGPSQVHTQFFFETETEKRNKSKDSETNNQMIFFINK